MPHALTSLPLRSTLPPPPTDIEARFEIDGDVERDLVRYVMTGFFNLATVARMQARQAEVAPTLRCPPNRHVTILDISGCWIQSQAVMQAFAAMLDQPRYRSRALAVVVGSSLARMQVTRILDRSGVEFFSTVAEAEAWLFDEAAASADADRLGD